MIDQSGPETALAKVACQIPPRYFTDYLAFLKTAVVVSSDGTNEAAYITHARKQAELAGRLDDRRQREHAVDDEGPDRVHALGRDGHAQERAVLAAAALGDHLDLQHARALELLREAIEDTSAFVKPLMPSSRVFQIWSRWVPFFHPSLAVKLRGLGLMK